MVEPINLNKARKARVKAADRAQATANRVSFGRTKGQKEAAKAEAKKASKSLDGQKRDPS